MILQHFNVILLVGEIMKQEFSNAKAHDIIKQLRQKKGISQKELADRVGLTQQAIALLENGKRKLEFDLFIDILNNLGTTSNELSEIIQTIFLQTDTKELKTLDELEAFFCYLESLDYKLSISDYADMKKTGITPHDNEDYLIGIQDNLHDNVTFFHKDEFVDFQKEIAKAVEYEIYKHFRDPNYKL